MSVFLRSTVSVSDNFNVYGLLGWSRMNFIAQALDVTGSDIETIGLRLNVEYLIYSFEDEFTYSGANVALQLTF